MPGEAEIEGMAHFLVDQHGERAPYFALASVGLLIERSDLERAAQWRRVSVAAAAILRERGRDEVLVETQSPYAPEG